MGNVQLIKKGRKERICGKCRSEIKVGEPYYKGVLNFYPNIIRCTTCGLQAWEVTTSDYQKSVGEIVYKWTDNYGVVEDVADSIKCDLEGILDEVQENFDNIPDSLQEAPAGELLQERISNLEDAINELEQIDIDILKEETVEECELFEGSDRYYDDIMDDVSVSDEDKQELQSSFEERLSMLISDALDYLCV